MIIVAQWRHFFNSELRSILIVYFSHKNWINAAVLNLDKHRFKAVCKLAHVQGLGTIHTKHVLSS